MDLNLAEALGGGPVGLDTALFIYFIEEDASYIDLVAPLFEAVASGELHAVTSELTLLETLVVPLRAGDRALADAYETILTMSEGLSLVPIDRALLRGAAQLRAATGTKTPDAIQLASALVRGCTSFVTNDRRLPDLPGMPVLQLVDLA